MTQSTEQLPLSIDVRALLDSIWAQAVEREASDVHVEPTASGCEIRFREDGLLRTISAIPSDVGRSIALRLMVLGHLLTYRLDVPQEGRAAINVDGREMEIRISIMPTINGLRAAVRLPAASDVRELDQLGFHRTITENLRRFGRAESGMLIVTGPAGSGKTTTIYAMLAHLAAQAHGLSIVSLEDPVERAIPGVTQIEVKPFGQLTYERALRSILRQDPQVLMLGEIRDVATAQLAMQAAMAGHRLISTLHAGSASGAITRMLEMGLEPYQITSALWGVLAQRLVRKKTESNCYHGRTAVGELLLMDPDLRSAVLDRADVRRLDETAAVQTGFVPMRHAALRLVENSATDQAEWDRVFGGESL
ncbi:MAG TPA: ATPase, T2SS/T4P/T4SS family [Tepidisphaeraceae bacterium]|nr:ATPase, T2SS/T4P/T4SS family [Tepidisphaeraceae bacterium]